MGTCLRKGNPLYPCIFLITGEGLIVMLNALDDSNLFTRYKFCHLANLHIFHLQFVHDTFILRKSWENINLIMFEVISRLKVNFYKCLFVCCECG